MSLRQTQPYFTDQSASQDDSSTFPLADLPGNLDTGTP